MKVSKLIIRGEKLPVNPTADTDGEVLKLERTYIITPETRGAENRQKIDVADDEVVEFVFEDQTSWLCNNETIDELFPDSFVVNRGGETEFDLPVTVSGDDMQRGLGDVVMKAVNIFKSKLAGKAIKEGVRKLADKLEDKLMGNFEGWYRLDSNFSFISTTSIDNSKPILLFLHGTAASAEASFKDLMGTDLWKFIHDQYGHNVTAFQHRTLSKFPFENLLNLVKTLPSHATLHLITQSGGGHLAELLSRFTNADENHRGFTQEEMNALKDGYGDLYKKDIEKVVDDIKSELKNKKINVERTIRVACPAAGSTLASKRLDHFMNMLMNLIGNAFGSVANPIYGAVKNLVGGVINCKNDADILPGIEVLNPKSGFMKALNNRHETNALENDLTVISGNATLKFNLKSLLILASKLFYLHENDLIVDTLSMYKGTKRTGLAQYFFTEGNDVNHFSYFKNEASRKAMLIALQTPGNIQAPGFKLISDLTLDAERNALLKLEMGQVFTDTVTGKKPIVVVLPGIMGSNLSAQDRLLWINYFKIIGGEITDLGFGKNGIKAPSLIKTSYKDLVDFLLPKYDVVTFPFDWRRQLNEIASDFNKKINDLLKFNQPVKIIGHSMGGVLVRDFIITHPDTWEKLNSSPGFRLVFLGSPLGGSFRIPAVLFGMDGIIDKLSMIDIKHSKKSLLKIFAQFPGILSLLPHNTDAENDFAKTETWNKLKTGVDSDWPLPSNNDLSDFKKYRDQILLKKSSLDYSNMVYIAGRDKETPCGYVLEKKGKRTELQILYTAEGDQSVTWETGIPAEMIKNNSVYYSEATHGGLSKDTTVFKGISEILEKGFTNAIPKIRPNVTGRGGKKVFKGKESFDFDLTAEGFENTVLGLSKSERSKASEAPISVSVSNCDLKYSKYPLIAGHFMKDGIVSSEKAIDKLLNGALTERHQLGIYPGPIGTSEILHGNNKNFKGVILLGLGEQDSFTAYQLSLTIEQGITKYLLNLSDSMNANNLFAGNAGVSALMVGGDFGGLSIESAVRAILQGIQRANRKVKQIDGKKTVLIEHVEFIEQYEDKSLSCFYALSRLEREVNQSLNITLESRKIKKGIGSKMRLPIENTDRWWNRISVKLIEEKKSEDGIRGLLFNSSTSAAREEQRKLYSTIEIINQLITDASVNNEWSPDLAKTIFELLIPNDFKEQFKRRGHINWILEAATAEYPWELLQDSGGDQLPLCVNAGMIRQLATEDFRPKINRVVNEKILVVGDPVLDGMDLGQLPGAAKEANVVKDVFDDNSFEVISIINGKAHNIINKLFSDEYKVIHLAGHGIFDPDKPAASGMVIGNEVYLTTREIQQMSTVPELVFVNCCFLGQVSADSEKFYKNRYKLAANIGIQLIEIGVKAVVVAGWAVGDSAALNFASEFYSYLFKGYTFGMAILEARKSTYEKYPKDNTWGAYQCYGDPFYVLKQIAQKQLPKTFIIPQEAEIELNNLYNELELGYSADIIQDRLEAITKGVDDASIRTASITQLEANIWAGLYRYDFAIDKIQQAFMFEDASFTVKLLEQYCNYRAKQCVIDIRKKNADRKKLMGEMDHVIGDLEYLLKIKPTAERFALIASAYKRKMLLETSIDHKLAACKLAEENYLNALQTGKGSDETYYLTNLIELQSIRQLLKPVAAKSTKSKAKKPELIDAKLVKRLKELYENAHLNETGQDYWKIVEIANLELCSFLINKNATAADLTKLKETYKSVWELAGSLGKKQSELEHLEILKDVLQNSKLPSAKTLKVNLDKLYLDLEKML